MLHFNPRWRRRGNRPWIVAIVKVDRKADLKECNHHAQCACNHNRLGDRDPTDLYAHMLYYSERRGKGLKATCRHQQVV